MQFTSFGVLANLNNHHYLIQKFPIAPKVIPHPYSHSSFAPESYSLKQAISINLLILDVSYIWILLYVVFCNRRFKLAYVVFSIHPYCSMHQHFMLYLLSNSIPLQDMPHCIYQFISWWSCQFVSTFGLLWIMLLWTLCTSFCVDIFSVLWVHKRTSKNCRVTCQLCILLFNV